jgi:uncharacterized protein YjbJ (UPF0337 family)
MGTKDKASNKAQDLKGKAKEATGKLIGNKDLEREGNVDQAKAAVKDLGEQVKDAAIKIKGTGKRA